jgi:capsular exopolysaccharide synthesis family protein
MISNETPPTPPQTAVLDALGVVRRHVILILACTALVTLAVAGFSISRAKKYTASASLLFSTTNVSAAVSGLSQQQNNSTPQAAQDTSVQLVKIGDVAARTAKALGHGLTTAAVQASLAVSSVSDTYVVTVSATTTSPRLSAAVANTYSSIFVEEQQTANRAYYGPALAAVEKQLKSMSPSARSGPTGTNLESVAQSLATLADVPAGSVQVAARAIVPTAPSSPKVAEDTLVGAVLGLLLGLLLAVLRERLDRTIKDLVELEQIYGVPSLGAIPESPELGLAADGRISGHISAIGAEAFQFVRARLRYFGVDRQLKSVLVVSAESGDGKTTVALHLAAAAVEAGSRVLLVEADLRRPTLAKRLGISPGPGLSDFLVGISTLDDSVRRVDWPAGVASDPDDQRSFSILTAGSTTPPNPTELLQSHAMKALIAESASTYDLVVIDTAPLAAVSDALPLVAEVDGTVVVSRLGSSHRDMAAFLARNLASTNATILGTVANGQPLHGPGAYRYDYSYITLEH